MEAPKIAKDETRGSRYRTLDMWRGVACLMIVAFHAAVFAIEKSRDPEGAISPKLVVFSWFYVGVPMFFIISGYCITATSLSTVRKKESPLEYFKRRFRRIYPPYWFVLGLTALLAVAGARLGFAWLLENQNEKFLHPVSLSWDQWLGNLTLTNTWLHHFVGVNEDLLVGQAWTLCYEEQFYLACGLLLFALPARFFAGAFWLSALILGMHFARARLSPGYPINGFFFDEQWFYFASGILVFYQINVARGVKRALLLLFLVCSSVVGLYKGIPWVYTVGVFGSVLVAIHPWDDRISGSKLLLPFAFCGQMCYSMYLTHIPVVNAISHGFYAIGLRSEWSTILVTIPTATAASLVIAWLFHLAVERHFMSPTSLATFGGPGAREGVSFRPSDPPVETRSSGQTEAALAPRA